MAPDRPPFPAYLLPSLTFPLRQRAPSSSSTTLETREYAVPYLSHSPSSSISTSPSSSPPTSPVTSNLKGLLHAALQQTQRSSKPRKARLETTQKSVLRCLSCATDIAFTSQIVSKGFTGRHGRAYLVGPPGPSSSPSAPAKASELSNIRIGRSVNRELLTGTHVVADVMCVICGNCLGWKYVDAKEQAQRYKIGKFILETKKVVLCANWENGAVEEEDVTEWDDADGQGVVVFDSEDEDECEDLFSGVWDAEIAAKRRARRVRK